MRRLFNTGPRCAPSGPRDIREVNAEFNGKRADFPSKSDKASNFQHIGLGELCLMMPFAAKNYAAALIETVLNVLRSRSSKQMIRAKARRIVAFVANINFLRYRTINKLVGDTMNKKCLSPDMHTAVPVSAVSGARPVLTFPIWRRILNKMFQQFKTANLVSHRRSLHCSLCMAVATFMRCAAFIIIAHVSISPLFSQFSNATRIQGRSIASTAPTDTQVLTWDAATSTWKPAAGGSASGVTTSGLTSGKIPKATGTQAIGDSLVSDNGTVVSVAAQFSIKANPFIIELPNSSTGTTNNKLAKIVNTAGVLQAEIISTSAADQASALGCVISGGGTSGTALIMIAGTGSCYFDAATTAGHIAVPSSTSAGALHDTGSASTPASGEVMATVGATNACGSPPCLIAGNLFMTPDVVATGGNGNGGGNGGGSGAKQQLHAIGFSIGDGINVISTGDAGTYPSSAFACTINRWDITAKQSGSITIDVWKKAGGIPSSGDKISASAPITLSTAQIAQNGSRSGWGNSVASGDVWGFSVASVTSLTHVDGVLYCQ